MGVGCAKAKRRKDLSPQKTNAAREGCGFGGTAANRWDVLLMRPFGGKHQERGMITIYGITNCDTMKKAPRLAGRAGRGLCLPRL